MLLPEPCGATRFWPAFGFYHAGFANLLRRNMNAFLPHFRPLNLLAIAACCALAACGGGSDETVASADAAPEGRAPTDTGPQPAPASAPQPPPTMPSPVPTPATASAQACGDLRELLAQINQARAQARSCGGTLMPAAPALDWHPALASAAAGYSADMAGNDFISAGHLGSDGSTPAARITRAGYAWRTIGENVAAGRPDAAGTVQQWLDSPPHCQNLMSRSFVHVGGACYANPRATYGHYWTLDLAAPR